MPRPAPSKTTLPGRAQVVIIGGGVIGSSVAYHLAEAGWTDVVLLERDKLTSGTTWHAAGLMTCFGTFSETSMQMRLYTRQLYRDLEAKTGQATGFNPAGFIEAAADKDRLEEYRRVAAFNRLCGLEVHEISPREISDRFPIADVNGLVAGFYVPGDGRVNPVDVTMALAKGARAHGIQIIEEVAATGVKVTGEQVRSVTTALGDIECDYVVNCTGMWARQFGQGHGVNIPLQAAEHYYLITEPIAGIDSSLPVFEDPSAHAYYREEGGGLMIGLFEPVCAPWNVDSIPEDFSFGEIQPDWDRMGPYLERAMQRVPISLETGIRKFFCGPESFTPDLKPFIGEAPGIRNYFVAAGMNSVGILTGGGVGRVVAHWIITGKPDVDVTGFNINRALPHQRNPRYRAERTVETLGLVYQTHYPGRTVTTARGVKRSPIHHLLKERGAYFRDVSGWEGADWYAPPGALAETGELTWGRPHWFDSWAVEHQAIREGVGFMDMSFMSKFLVQGEQAGALLDYVSANAVNGADGVITYTQWLNDSGTIEADLTVTKLANNKFFVVASDTAHGQVLQWLTRHGKDFAATVTDVTSGYAQFNIHGPRSRELLQAVTTADMSNSAFPYRTAREIDLGFARALCIRITYVGELGYELYIPTEQAVHAYERLCEAGNQVQLVHCGLKSLASLRMEKAYRDYGHDIDNTDSVLEAGLGFAVAWDKESAFIGRDAALKLKNAGPLRRRLVQVRLLDPLPLLYHGEILMRDGEVVGYVRAGSYGHTLGGAVGLAMVDATEPITADYLTGGTWEVDVAGLKVPAITSLRPMYDPANEKVTGI
ncbi:MAG: FAD-dependent oxidoreductase [Actinomycetota bacterium]|nr:FAD-dependent oxidoreductase [Actinomycetota bacterium]